MSPYCDPLELEESRNSALLLRMPHAQDEDARGPNLVAHLVLAHENAADLARLELLELLSDARLVEESARDRRQRLQHAGRRAWVHRRQEVLTWPASTSARASRVRRCRSSSWSIQADSACFTIQPRERSRRDRKSTRLNSSHNTISYAVF